MEQGTIFDLIKEQDREDEAIMLCKGLAEWKPKERILLIFAEYSLKGEYPHELIVLSHGEITRRERFKFRYEMGERLMEVIRDYGKYDKNKNIEKFKKVGDTYYSGYILKED